MKRISAIFMTMVLTFAISCEKPEKPENSEEPDAPGQEEPELKKNTYTIGHDTGEFASVMVSNLGEYLCIAASPESGVDAFESIFEQEEYFYVAVSPLLNGVSFDIMVEERLYTVMSTLEGAFLESVAPSMREEVVSGTCCFRYADGKADVDIQLLMADGTKFAACLSAEEPTLVVNENVFEIDNVQKPVRTAFHMVEDGITALYLTPAGISYYDELEITTYYAYLILNDSQCHGRTLDVKDIVAAGYVDNFNDLVVDSNEVPATGTVNVAADPENPAHYIVSADIDFDGTPLKLRYDGIMLDAGAKEEVRNEIIYKGSAYPVQKVVLDTASDMEDVYKVTMYTGENDYLDIYLPVGFLDGNAHGFSQSPYLFVEYDGTIFSKAEGYNGTVTVEADAEIISIEATNYKNLEITYVGPYETATKMR